MRNAWLIAFREFLENVRTKGFWLGILMMPLTLVLVGAMPLLVNSTKAAKSFAVIDYSGTLPAINERILAADLDKLLTRYDEQSAALMPDTLMVYLPELRALDDPTREMVIDHILRSGPLPDELPRRVAAYLERNATTVNDWWRSLSAQDKAALSPAISTNDYRQQPGGSEDELNQQLISGELFAYFILEAELLEDSRRAQYISNNLTDQTLQTWFGRHVSQHVQSERLAQSNLDAETAKWISEPVEFEGITIGKDGTREVDSQDVVRQWAPVAFVFFLWISILINTQLLLTNTVEEKSNKLIEVLLSSVSPIELMAGKILGIAGTGLTIIGCWGLILLLFFIGLPSLAGANLPVDPVAIIGEPRALALFLMYFVLGYLLYAALLVGLGSLCNNLKDAQNLIMPVQMIQLIPMLLLVPIAQDPNGSLAVFLSYIPPLTPFVMMNRTAGPPTSMEYITTTVLLVISIVIAFWFAAKLFRIGILMTGKPPSLREIGKLLKAPVIMPAAQTRL